MTDAVEPPIPLPPAASEKTPAQIAAIFTVVSGLAIAACTFTPVIYLNSNGTVVQNLQLSGTGDGSLFVIAGLLVAAFGVARYLEDRHSFRLLSGLLGAGVLLMIYYDTKDFSEKVGQYTSGTGMTYMYGPAFFLVGVAAVAAIITSESKVPLKTKPKPSQAATPQLFPANTSTPETAPTSAPETTSAPAAKSDKTGWARKLDEWGSKPDWSSKLGSDGSSDNVASITVLGVLAAVGAIVVIAVIASNHASAPPADSMAPSTDYTLPIAPTPEPVAHTTQVTPIVRGMYPAETEIGFLQACEASADSFANAKCNCDLSKLESSVSPDRLLAIEANTAAGQPLPDDVSAMFDSCKTING